MAAMLGSLSLIMDGYTVENFKTINIRHNLTNNFARENFLLETDRPVSQKAS